MVSNQNVTRRRTILLVIVFALLPLVVFIARGDLEFYWRARDVQVLVNGVPAGYMHTGRHSRIITRTDLPGNHSYRAWETATEVMIFDCHTWVAPDRLVFPQGRISSPCTLMTSGSVTSPASPATHARKNVPLEFTTRDGKVIRLQQR